VALDLHKRGRKVKEDKNSGRKQYNNYGKRSGSGRVVTDLMENINL
jgi:hypothetical protein